ncbi:MAG: hypothetical protein ACFFE4_00490 [Candidatus Thorarchaeota archaeon]
MALISSVLVNCSAVKVPLVRVILFVEIVQSPVKSVVPSLFTKSPLPPADNATVPLSFGNVIVLSAVGFSTVKVVSYLSSIEPSKIIVPLPFTL